MKKKGVCFSSAKREKRERKRAREYRRDRRRHEEKVKPAEAICAKQSMRGREVRHCQTRRTQENGERVRGVLIPLFEVRL